MSDRTAERERKPEMVVGAFGGGFRADGRPERVLRDER